MRKSVLLSRALGVAALLGSISSAQAIGVGNFFGALAGRPGEIGQARSIDDTLLKVSAQMNRKVPMNIDKSTRLDKVSSEPGQQLTYHYTLLGTSSADLKVADFSSMINSPLIARVCSSSEMQIFLQNGVTVKYLYRGSDGKPLGGAKVTTQDCSTRRS
ncbi:MAG: hypothetical protein ACRYGK_13490 [Janthinobacterium lividum]